MPQAQAQTLAWPPMQVQVQVQAVMRRWAT